MSAYDEANCRVTYLFQSESFEVFTQLELLRNWDEKTDPEYILRNVFLKLRDYGIPKDTASRNYYLKVWITRVLLHPNSISEDMLELALSQLEHCWVFSTPPAEQIFFCLVSHCLDISVNACYSKNTRNLALQVILRVLTYTATFSGMWEKVVPGVVSKCARIIHIDVCSTGSDLVSVAITTLSTLLSIVFRDGSNLDQRIELILIRITKMTASDWRVRLAQCRMCLLLSFLEIDSFKECIGILLDDPVEQVRLLAKEGSSSFSIDSALLYSRLRNLDADSIESLTGLLRLSSQTFYNFGGLGRNLVELSGVVDVTGIERCSGYLQVILENPGLIKLGRELSSHICDIIGLIEEIMSCDVYSSNVAVALWLVARSSSDVGLRKWIAEWLVDSHLRPHSLHLSDGVAVRVVGELSEGLYDLEPVILLPLLARISDDHKPTAHNSLVGLNRYSGGELDTIISRNSDYIVDSLALKLRVEPNDTSSVRMITALSLKLRGHVVLFPVIRDVTEDILLAIDEVFWKSESVLCYLKALRGFIHVLGGLQCFDFVLKMTLPASSHHVVFSDCNYTTAYAKLCKVDSAFNNRSKSNMLDTSLELLEGAIGNVADNEGDSEDDADCDPSDSEEVILIERVLYKCIQFLELGHRNLCYVSLDCIEKGIPLLSISSTLFLPVIAKSWDALKYLIFNTDDLSIIKRVLAIINTAGLYGAYPFLSRRFQVDLWPYLKIRLEGIVETISSCRLWKRRDFQDSIQVEVLFLSLVFLHRCLNGMELRFDIVEVGNLCTSLLLYNWLPDQLREQVCLLVSDLCSMDSDVVWALFYESDILTQFNPGNSTEQSIGLSVFGLLSV